MVNNDFALHFVLTSLEYQISGSCDEFAVDEVWSISAKSALDHDEQHDETDCFHSWKDFPDEPGVVCQRELPTYSLGNG